MNWSPLQLALYDFAKYRRENLVVQARAGTGKSTTLVEIAARVAPRRVLICSFTNKIRDDLIPKVQHLPHVTVKGINQMGYAAVIKRAGKPPEVDRWRIHDYIRRQVPPAFKAAHGDLAKLVGLCMVTLSQTPEAIRETMYAYDLRPEMKEHIPLWVDWVTQALNWSLLPDQNSVSFVEQVYIPAALNLATGSFDVVIVDECQDLSAAQFRVVINAMRPGGRFIAVGDPAQAIYNFNGAGANSVDEIINATDAHVLPLSITYRCPTEVVRLVKPLVPDYEAGPGAPTGKVELVGLKSFLQDVQEGDAVIARANAALTKVALELIAMGKRARIVGKDIGAQLSKLTEVGQGVGGDNIKTTLTYLTDYVYDQCETLVAARKEDKAEELQDNLEALRALSSGCEDMYAVRSKITRLFNDDDVTQGTIPCMSTHKAKGLEFERVWMLESTFKVGSSEGANLYYVAATRAKKELYLVQTPNQSGKVPPSWAVKSGFFKGQEEEDDKA